MSKKALPKQRQPKVSDALRQAIRDSGLSWYRVAKDSNVSYPTVQRFMRDERSLSLGALDKICTYLGLQLKR
jgi:transcriptional regulator with XRE-family HTH domain